MILGAKPSTKSSLWLFKQNLPQCACSLYQGHTQSPVPCWATCKLATRSCRSPGQPYDTLKEVIGLEGDEPGNLISLGVKYQEIDLDPADETDETLIEKIKKAAPSTRCMFYIQKSCGYSIERRSFNNKDISRLCKAAKSIHQNSIVFVDNCYGEFVERNEPTAVGADLLAGSLIKNPGGGLAITGGYVAGETELVDRALNRLTSPGIGGHLGLTYNQNRLVLQGLFMAPAVVSNAVKGAMLFAATLAELGCEVSPPRWTSAQTLFRQSNLPTRIGLSTFAAPFRRGRQSIRTWSPSHR